MGIDGELRKGVTDVEIGPMVDERVLNPQFTFVSDFESALSWTSFFYFFLRVCKGVVVKMRAVNGARSVLFRALNSFDIVLITLEVYGGVEVGKERLNECKKGRWDI